MSSQKCCFRACDLDASTLRICQTETTCCDKEPKLCFHHVCVAEFNFTMLVFINKNKDFFWSIESMDIFEDEFESLQEELDEVEEFLKENGKA